MSLFYCVDGLNQTESGWRRGGLRYPPFSGQNCCFGQGRGAGSVQEAGRQHFVGCHETRRELSSVPDLFVVVPVAVKEMVVTFCLARGVLVLKCRGSGALNRVED